MSSFLIPYGDHIREAGRVTYRIAQDCKRAIEPRWVLSFLLGAGTCLIYSPLTTRLISVLGVAPAPDPFGGLNLLVKILIAPITCVVAPLTEEVTFRDFIQDGLKDFFEDFAGDTLGLSRSDAKTFSTVASLFFTSVAFGLIHFSNALFFWCNPLALLPQVIATMIMGLIFGLAKELTGDIMVPIAMHMGNNVLAMVSYLLNLN